MRAKLPLAALCMAGLTLVLAACATGGSPAAGPEEADAYQAYDPIEPVNRAIFGFNETLDRYVIKPVAIAYHDTLPAPVRHSVRNFLNNLNEPVIFADQLLQGRVRDATNTFSRLVINSVFGVAGLFDVAGSGGNTFQTADFGQTLGVWGIGPGPYLVIPILGPSDLRDTLGLIGDSYADPADEVAAADNAWGPIIGRSVVSAVDLRSRYISSLDRLRSTSLDYYATLRAVYLQRRAAVIRHETPPGVVPGLTQ